MFPQPKLDTIKDYEMRNEFSNFLNNVEINKSSIQRINSLISIYEDIELKNLNWEILCDIVHKIDASSSLSHRFGLLNLKFIYFLMENELYIEDNMEYLKKLINELIVRPNGSKSERIIIFDKDITNFVDFNRFFICKTSDDYSPYNLLIDTKTNNKFIVDLLDKFYKSKLNGVSKTVTSFAERFGESYDFSSFNDISDFNYSVFKSQFDFYKNNHKELLTLIKFYIHLYVISEYTPIFSNHDPVDMFWLQKNNFAKLYKEGFELVDLNPNEQFPPINKWVVRPNGFEKTTTKLKSTSYVSLDFSKIKCDYYINFAKHFYWHSNLSLKARNDALSRLIIFLNFIYEYKKNNISAPTNGIDYKKITTVEIYSFTSHIATTTKSTATYNSYINTASKFLRMCVDKNFLDIESGAFDFLYTAPKPKPNGGDSIPDEDLTKLQEHLRELSEGDNLFYNLCYIIFHLAIETNLRISQLLSLRKSEIVEGMKKNQWAIHSISKTSKGEKEIQQISIYTKRHLDIAIKHTEQFRNSAIDEYEDYIFLIPPNLTSSNKDIKPIERYLFNDFLKKQCEKLGIRKYTAENLRDTHMTRAIEFSFKHGLSDAETSILTNHADTSTTNKHYVDYKVKTFAEATYGVIIGDIDIKGNIIADYNTTFTAENTVDDNCGFCNEDECKLFNELGCPMCDGFVVTLDRIPYYEQKIKDYDAAIEKEVIAHEKEHLAARRKLYVAYLTELYKLKEEVDNNES